MSRSTQNPDRSAGNGGRSRLQLLDMVAGARPVHWIGASIFILLVDYLTGPFIQFPILFIFPVAVAAAAHGLGVGVSIAALLPLMRLSFFLRWDLPSSWILELIDTAVDMIILIGFAALITEIVGQQRQIRVLKGMLPICSFCNRIRDERGQWRQLEAFITERSEALFSHTFCEQCGRAHYPEHLREEVL